MAKKLNVVVKNNDTFNGVAGVGVYIVDKDGENLEVFADYRTDNNGVVCIPFSLLDTIQNHIYLGSKIKFVD